MRIPIDLIHDNSYWFDPYIFLLIWYIRIPIDLFHMNFYWIDPHEFLLIWCIWIYFSRFVVNTYYITSSRTYLSRYNPSSIKLEDWIPGNAMKIPLLIQCSTRTESQATNATKGHKCSYQTRYLHNDPKWWGGCNLVIYKHRVRYVLNVSHGHKPSYQNIYMLIPNDGDDPL